jgi:hypothetical protein
MNKRMRMLSFLLVLTALTGQAYPSQPMYLQQQCGGIVGRITTSDGALVPGVIITAKSKETKKTATAISDYKGQYALCLVSGSYDVLINDAAYRRAERKSIKVTQATISTLDFVLKLGKPIIIDPEHP